MIRMPLQLLALLFATAMAGPALAFDLDDLQQRLNDTEALQGRFEQQRYLADLDSRLNSRGRFLYERDTRVVWILESPVEDRLEFTPESAPEIADSAGGGERRRDQIAALFLRLLGGDWQALEERFAIELSGTAEDWRVTLTPRSDALRERLTRIRLSGARYLERLELQAANDDVLEVRFFDQRPLGSSTSAGEAEELSRLGMEGSPGAGRSEGLLPWMAKVAPKDGFTAPSRRPAAGRPPMIGLRKPSDITLGEADAATP